jgi:hypothetical protein
MKKIKRLLFWLTAPFFLLAVMTGTTVLLLVCPAPRSSQRAAATRLKEDE